MLIRNLISIFVVPNIKDLLMNDFAYVVKERYCALGGYDTSKLHLYRTKENALDFIKRNVESLVKSGYEVTFQSDTKTDLRNTNWTCRDYEVLELKFMD